VTKSFKCNFLSFASHGWAMCQKSTPRCSWLQLSLNETLKAFTYSIILDCKITLQVWMRGEE
jgi:hypothetical protein